MADCNSGCGQDMGEASFIFAGLRIPLTDEGDLVVYDIEETEFNNRTDNQGNNEIYSYKSETDLDATVRAHGNSDEYNQLYEMWRCNKGICSDVVVNNPCYDPKVFERVKIKKMGIPSVSYDNEPVEIIFTGYIPKC